ncbi:hypothetical protein ABL78_6588 [Leptomonas seymouri]|uniref:Uncharacterized protein n=1 Tax=Leptomonas seymouri TaxID=5684 RepID=A0A0N0P3P2_LEPSE|nr:hypothetical protein ABL78_6588 [Leptomonas seymouri]|eukprot:KPI84359.1 hypothetical protein ABL78_6588 [Leptomonas seymouri]
MALRSKASLRNAGVNQKPMGSPRTEKQQQLEDGPHTYAEYLECRRGLVSAILDEQDEHALQMEERARQAVARAAAIIQSSHSQEKERLDYLHQLEGRIQALQQARRTAAAELDDFQQSAAETRQRLVMELDEVQQRTKRARAGWSAVQTALQQHRVKERATESGAAQRCGEAAEQQLQSQVTAVEARFQQAVAVLQAQVQERKVWADAQCAMCDVR